MSKSPAGGLESVFDALNRGGVRYVLVGGLAVVLHGYARLTADIDLVVDLEPEEARKAIDALVKLGFKPRPPVDPRGFADPEVRRSWIEDKGMMVFTMFDPANPMRVVDLFVASPLPFAELWARAEVLALSSTSARVASIEDLIRIKRRAGRPRDIEDIEALEEILQRQSDGA